MQSHGDILIRSVTSINELFYRIHPTQNLQITAAMVMETDDNPQLAETCLAPTGVGDKVVCVQVVSIYVQITPSQMTDSGSKSGNYFK